MNGLQWERFFRYDSEPYDVEINKKGKEKIDRIIDGWLTNSDLKDKKNNVIDKALLYGELRNYTETNSPLKKNDSIKYYKDQDPSV